MDDFSGLANSQKNLQVKAHAETQSSNIAPSSG